MVQKLLALWMLLNIPFFARAESLTIDGKFLRDETGGIVLLRGVNVSADLKTPPFTEKLKPSDFDPLPSWGVNSIRLVFIWEAFEPMKGEYDHRYLAWFSQMVTEATHRNMRVIIDIHPDAFSRYAVSGCGCGFPKWTVSGVPNEPDNGPRCRNWGDQMLVNAQYKQSFRDFYANINQVRDQYLKVVEILAKRFHPNEMMLGFDLLNEPWGDWNSQLLPLYTDAEKIIHKHAPKQILFLEPSLGRVSMGPGLTLDPWMQKPSFGGYVFAPHYYDVQMLALGRIWLDFTSSEIGKMEAIAQEWNVPLWVGEFSAPRYSEDPARNEHSMKYVDRIYAELDSRFLSASQWAYTPSWSVEKRDGWNLEDVSINDDKGNFRNFRIRSYAQRVSGMPLQMKEDPIAGRFLFEWNNDPTRGYTMLFSRLQGPLQLEPKGMKCKRIEQFQIRCISAQSGKHSVAIAGGGVKP